MEWIITPEIKAKYDTYFEGIDKNHEGIVSGEQARGLFMASNLPQNILAGIWLVCMSGRGRGEKAIYTVVTAGDCVIFRRMVS